MEVRQSRAYEDKHWLFAFNPIVDLALAGPDYHRGPWFQPAAMAVFKLFQLASVGVEYYGDLGPFSGFASGREQEHYVFEFSICSRCRTSRSMLESAKDSRREATRSL